MIKTLTVFLLFPLQILAQDITGLWTGYIHTADKNLPYELAISDNNGKLSGFSHTTFTVNGIAEVGVKSVTIAYKNGQVLIEDGELIFNNFSNAPAKGVRQSDFLIVIIEDTVMKLNGTFKTSKTRMYRPVSGSIQLTKAGPSKNTKIMAKLGELNLLSTLSFLKPKIKESETIAVAATVKEKFAPLALIKKADPAAVIRVSTSVPALKPKAMAESSPPLIPNKPAVIVADITPVAKAVASVPVAVSKSQPLSPINKQFAAPLSVIKSKPLTIDTLPLTGKVTSKLPDLITKTSPISSPGKKPLAAPLPAVIPGKPAVMALPSKQTAVVKPPVVIKKEQGLLAVKVKDKPAVIASTPVVVKKEEPVSLPQTPKNTTAPAILPALKLSSENTSVVSAAELTKRKTETVKSVYFKSDSLVISLYDNGEVDGDTVSVVLNGKIILANQGLSTNAITKTIYITPDIDSLQLVMYAENLGSIPPNTGLLILQDGDDRYEIRFAGDYQKNSAVLLKRRKL